MCDQSLPGGGRSLVVSLLIQRARLSVADLSGAVEELARYGKLVDDWHGAERSEDVDKDAMLFGELSMLTMALTAAATRSEPGNKHGPTLDDYKQGLRTVIEDLKRAGKDKGNDGLVSAVPVQVVPLHSGLLPEFIRSFIYSKKYAAVVAKATLALILENIWLPVHGVLREVAPEMEMMFSGSLLAGSTAFIFSTFRREFPRLWNMHALWLSAWKEKRSLILIDAGVSGGRAVRGAMAAAGDARKAAPARARQVPHPVLLAMLSKAPDGPQVQAFLEASPNFELDLPKFDDAELLQWGTKVTVETYGCFCHEAVSLLTDFRQLQKTLHDEVWPLVERKLPLSLDPDTDRAEMAEGALAAVLRLATAAKRQSADELKAFRRFRQQAACRMYLLLEAAETLLPQPQSERESCGGSSGETGESAPRRSRTTDTIDSGDEDDERGAASAAGDSCASGRAEAAAVDEKAAPATQPVSDAPDCLIPDVRRWLRNPLGHVVTPSDEPGKVAIEYTTDDVPDRSLEEAWQQLKHTLATGCVRPDGEHVSDGEMRFDAGAWTQLQKDLLDLCEPALFCRAPKCLLTHFVTMLETSLKHGDKDYVLPQERRREMVEFCRHQLITRLQNGPPADELRKMLDDELRKFYTLVNRFRKENEKAFVFHLCVARALKALELLSKEVHADEKVRQCAPQV